MTDQQWTIIEPLFEEKGGLAAAASLLPVFEQTVGQP
jgi:hypothetical protein